MYNNAQAASYAKEKLHGFEYPPGQRLIVKYDYPNAESNRSSAPPVTLPNNVQNSVQYPGSYGKNKSFFNQSILSLIFKNENQMKI